jgi:ABC-type glycerol-3-phosphate transport system permease component
MYKKNAVITVALFHLEGEYTKNWGELMAGYTIASILLIIMFL